MYARGALLAAAAAVAAAATFDLSIAVVNSSSAEVGSQWFQAGRAGLSLRVGRADGSPISTSSVCGTIPTGGQFAFSGADGASGTGLSVGAGVRGHLYVTYPLTIGDSTAAGRYGITLPSSAMACGADTSNAVATADSVRLGFRLTNFAVKVGSTVVSGRLNLANATVLDNGETIVPTHTQTTVTLTMEQSGATKFTNYSASLSTLAYGAVFNWPAGVPAPASVAQDVTAGTITYTITSFAAASGVYEIALPAGKLSDDNANASLVLLNAPQVIRFVYGMPALLKNAITGAAATQRAQNASFTTLVTNAASAKLSQVVAATGTRYRLQDMYTSLTRLGATNDLSSIVTGYDVAGNYTTTGPVQLNMDLSFAGLAEGTFVATRNASVTFPDASGLAEPYLRSIVLVIDRTAPVAKSQVWTGARQVVGSTGFVKLPTSLFTDAVSSSESQITVTAITPVSGDGNGFIGVVPAPLSAAYLVASTVRGAPADLAFQVTARDEAGNTATAILSLTTYAGATPSLTVADARGVYTKGPMRTGGTLAKTSGSLVLTAIASFTDSITGITASDLTVPVGASVTSVVSSANDRVFTFTITFSSYTTDTTGSIVLVRAAGTRNSDGASTSASNTVVLQFDTAAPTIASYRTVDATLSSPFFAYVPLSMRTADTSGGSNTLGGTSAANTVIAAVSSDDSGGLTLTLDKLGRAFVYGSPSALPATKTCGGTSGNFVKFTATLSDEAGNTASTEVCIRVAAAVSSTFSVAKSALGFTEGGASPKVDAAATFASDALAVGVAVYLDTPDDDGALAEALNATAPLGYTLTAYAQSADDNIGSMMLSGASNSTDNIPSSVVTAFIQSVTYTNTKTMLTPGARTVRFVVLKAGTPNNQVISYAARAMTVSLTNNAPTLTGTLSATYTEASDFATGTSLFAAGITVADADDTSVTTGKVVIKMTASTGVHGACDTMRDMLELPAAYSSAPAVAGVWSPAICTLLLRPVTGTSVTLADMSAALGAVRYRNNNETDPAAMQTADWKLVRRVEAFVTDNAANAQAGAPATSLALAGNVTIVADDDAPVVIRAAWYGAGGVAYSTSPTAGIKALEFADKPGVTYNVRKFGVTFNASGTDTTVSTLSLNLAKVSDGVFAAGGIVDYDSADPPTNGTAIALSFVRGDQTPFTPAGIAVPATLGADGALYSTSARSTVNVTVTQDAATFTGEVGLVLTYPGGTAAIVWLDVRSSKCRGDATFNPVNNVPDAAACSLAATSVNGTTGGVVSVGGYTAQLADFDAKQTIMNQGGLSLAQQVADPALASMRGLARGVFGVTFAANSFASASATLAITADPAKSDVIAKLPAAGEGETVDATAVVRLGPACQTFTEPVEVCIYIGDTPAGFTRALRSTSQLDCADFSKGYGPLRPMSEVAFDPVSGRLCGKVHHFTSIVPILVPITPAVTVPKSMGMGGACPNDCSGHGFCRAEGRCLCFAGYAGIDCGDRACPADESWDAADGIVHSPAECSNRGVCDRGSGKCKCYPGFEGAACQRNACPSGCSGHGRCRLLKDLPKVQQAGYTSWETSRMQVCRCDGGYTGLDCGQRACAFGDDPETVCQADGREVQTVTLDFGSIPASASLATNGVFDSDEFSLAFTHADGTNFTTARIADVFDAPTGAANIKKALKALPSFAISDVVVSGTSTPASVSYAITFDGASFAFSIGNGAMSRSTASGNTVPGPQNLFRCPVDAAGSMGCTAAGCRPLFKQMRLLDAPTSGVTLSAPAVLQQPAALSASHTTTNQWGVEATVTIRTPAATGVQTFEVTSLVYGQSSGTSGPAASVPETPIPPTGLRTNVGLVYGLAVDFADTITDGTYTFKWRLPACTVTQTRAASIEFEALECSGRGVCDRKAGQCRCFAGYAGFNCGQQTVIV